MPSRLQVERFRPRSKTSAMIQDTRPRHGDRRPTAQLSDETATRSRPQLRKTSRSESAEIVNHSPPPNQRHSTFHVPAPPVPPHRGGRRQFAETRPHSLAAFTSDSSLPIFDKPLQPVNSNRRQSDPPPVPVSLSPPKPVSPPSAPRPKIPPYSQVAPPVPGTKRPVLDLSGARSFDGELRNRAVHSPGQQTPSPSHPRSQTESNLDHSPRRGRSPNRTTAIAPPIPNKPRPKRASSTDTYLSPQNGADLPLSAPPVPREHGVHPAYWLPSSPRDKDSSPFQRPTAPSPRASSFPASDEYLDPEDDLEFRARSRTDIQLAPAPVASHFQRPTAPSPRASSFPASDEYLDPADDREFRVRSRTDVQLAPAPVVSRNLVRSAPAGTDEYLDPCDNMMSADEYLDPVDEFHPDDEYLDPEQIHGRSDPFESFGPEEMVTASVPIYLEFISEGTGDLTPPLPHRRYSESDTKKSLDADIHRHELLIEVWPGDDILRFQLCSFSTKPYIFCSVVLISGVSSKLCKISFFLTK